MKKIFGNLPSGKTVYAYTIQNEIGFSLTAINLGGIITSLSFPFQSGQANVVLGYPTLYSYLPNRAYLGAIVGRCANRIDSGKFQLNNRFFQLQLNDGLNHLHGGLYGFDQQYWEIQIGQLEHFPSLILSYFSKDGEEGYPGDIETQVVYQLRNNELRIIFKASASEPTIVNLTQHSYFNLADKQQSITDHFIQIQSERFAPVNEMQIPNMGLQQVLDTPFDCRNYTRIQDIISHQHLQLTIGKGIDHSWETRSDLENPIATLLYKEQGRGLSVYTNQAALHVYSGNHLPIIGMPKHAGICFETQAFPDSINQTEFKSPILLPGQMYHHETIFKFFDV